MPGRSAKQWSTATDLKSKISSNHNAHQAKQQDKDGLTLGEALLGSIAPSGT
jgi:hypothetical protein